MNKKTYQMPVIQVVNIKTSALLQASNENTLSVKGETSGNGISFGNSSEYAGDDNEDW
jgi:hypothetical protein